MLPDWFRPVALLSSLLGWGAVIVTLVLMILNRRKRRLAEEALRAEQTRVEDLDPLH